ncbi:hypothetical protein [Streptomyces sp. TS71-3]|uniref:hypothetical protein n=1 Tax=Streptomyces sp. TS71-3 TaxID=2733862 RepID=UPI001B0E9878|nr:hypothetical protein [Streptomyces sp. TS71-3]GHJ40403.1 hypothetical protein Sm713_60120 [Streptomyces sp. TS71-3]
MRSDDEPVFMRDRSRTNHWVYNPRSPVGRVLIAVTLVGIAVVLLLMANHAGPFAYPDPAPTHRSPSPDLSRRLPAAEPPTAPGGHSARTL